MLSPFYSDFIEAGCDEAGRGPLAGPVFAAAVILPRDFHHPLLNDSKQISEKVREELRPIIEREALAWAVTAVDAEEIDRINILKASIVGMQRSLDQLTLRPEFIIVDGNKFAPYMYKGEIIPHKCIVKGDAKFASIAAASILAKTYRDDFMREAAKQYPQYGWERNFGYPTKEHREAIIRYGETPLHRKSFHCKNEDLTLF
ncbi:MAG: ribonuclease HII [Bacteroidales bacterium]|nr:ribonuclease HII [Bacteroidales bacterium]